MTTTIIYLLIWWTLVRLSIVGLAHPQSFANLLPDFYCWQQHILKRFYESRQDLDFPDRAFSDGHLGVSRCLRIDWTFTREPTNGPVTLTSDPFACPHTVQSHLRDRLPVDNKIAVHHQVVELNA